MRLWSACLRASQRDDEWPQRKVELSCVPHFCVGARGQLYLSAFHPPPACRGGGRRWRVGRRGGSLVMHSIRHSGMNRLHKTTSMGALHNTNDIGNYYLSNEGGLSDGEAGIMNPQTFQHGGQTKIRGYASDDHLSRYRYIIVLFRLSCVSGLSSF